ncbi:MAG: hypothetical protein IK101_00540 [Oscillospiraceae bacterium]|nr:hypothetical protein [Oscillospiraceae bacterium]
MGSYDDLVFTIPQEFHHWYGFVAPRGFFRGTTMMKDAKVYMDWSAVDKSMIMEVPHTHHCADEYLVFTTADMKNFFDWDAEVDVWIGEDPENLEMYTLTAPTLIRIPPKFYHCPVHFRKINPEKPIVFSAVYLDGDWSKIGRKVDAEGNETFTYDGAGVRRCVKDRTKECIYCGECFSAARKERMKTAMAPRDDEWLRPYHEMAARNQERKWAKYVHPYVPEYLDDDRYISPRGGFHGKESMEGSKLWYHYGIVKRECEIGDLHMHHAVEEYLFFTGADIARFFDFDAEIEIELGPDPDHLEKYTITEPTAVRIPAGVWHGPVKIKRLGAPINFEPFYPNGSYGKIVYRDGVYVYEGNDLPQK